MHNTFNSTSGMSKIGTKLHDIIYATPFKTMPPPPPFYNSRTAPV